MNFYLLSILDRIAETLEVIGALGGLLAFCLCVWYFIQRYEDSEHELLPKIKRGLIAALVVCVVFSVCAVLVPTKADLIQAYLIVEGRKVLTAENIEQITDAVVERIEEPKQESDLEVRP